MKNFRLHKGDRVATIQYSGSDVFKKGVAFESLDIKRVVGIDTESLTVGKGLKTVLVPVRFRDKEVLIETKNGKGMLIDLLRVLGDEFGEEEDRPSRTAQRPRKDGDRHGRRKCVDPALLVFFNLPYDIGRLAADAKDILKAIASGADTYRVPCGHFEIEVSRMIMGAGASFEWFVRYSADDGRHMIMRLVGIDMVGYWKTSLKKAAKAVGATDKIDINPELYTKPLERFTDDEWEEFKGYSLGDVQTTLELYHATVALLRTVDARVVRRNGAIPPSAPGAAAKITFSKAFDIHDIDSWNRYPAWADQMGCDAYYGGRAFCAHPGIFKDMTVLDLKSAYPFAMSLLPDPVTVKIELVSEQKFTETFFQKIKGKFGVLYVDGDSTDQVYPAFRVHDGGNKRLRYVYGKFEDQAITIPEIVIGIVSGSLKITNVRKGVIMNGESETSFFKVAMSDFFAIKEDPTKEKALQNMAKLLANSTYGKIIEVQQTQFYIESQVMCPPFADLYRVANVLAKLYAETVDGTYDEKVSLLFDRCSKHKIDCTEKSCFYCGPEPTEDGPSIPLQRKLSAFKQYRCGQYFLPLYAAQVTGFTSACLGLMARLIGAIQGDTDSVHALGAPDTSSYYLKMEEAGYPAPKTGIGSWASETKEPSRESVCVRPKMYSHVFSDGSFKQAKHGFSKYPNGERELHEALKRVVSGNSVIYNTRPAPRKLREAIIAKKEVGEFIQRQVEVSHVKDPNVEYINGTNYWKDISIESRKDRKGSSSHAERESGASQEVSQT